MANIATYLRRIREAVYGKDVRSSIHDAIDAINNEVVDVHSSIDTFIQSETDDILWSAILPAQGRAAGDRIRILEARLGDTEMNTTPITITETAGSFDDPVVGSPLVYYSAEDYPNWYYTNFNVTPGAIYKITTWRGPNRTMKAYMTWLDSNNNVVAWDIGPNDTTEELVHSTHYVMAPLGCTKAVVQSCYNQNGIEAYWCNPVNVNTQIGNVRSKAEIVASDVGVIGAELGDVKAYYTNVAKTVATGAFKDPEFGEPLSYYSAGEYPSWRIATANVSPNVIYRIKLRRTANSSTLAYCVLLDANDKVVGAAVPGTNLPDNTYHYVYTTSDTAKMVVQSFYHEDGISIENVSFVSLQSQIDEMSYKIGASGNETENLKELIGDVNMETTSVSITPEEASFKNPTIGSQIEYYSATDYPNWYIVRATVEYGEFYKIWINRTNNASITAYVAWLDANNNVVAIDVPGRGGGNAEYSAHYVKVPFGATKLLVQSYGNQNGITIDKITHVDSLQSQIDVLNSGSGVRNSLPSYYTDSWLTSIYDKIRKLSEDVPNGIVFGFITDIRFKDNSGYSKYLMKGILENTQVPFFICGGGFTGLIGSDEDMDSWAYEANKLQDYLGAEHFYILRGARDFCVRYTEDGSSGYTATGEYTYNYLMRKQEPYVSNLDRTNMCYTIDIPGQNVRFICLNSYYTQSAYPGAPDGVLAGIGQTQAEWFINRLKDFPDENRKIIIVSHVASDQALTNATLPSQEVISQISKACNNRTTVHAIHSATGVDVEADFTDCKATVICQISGYGWIDASHKDGYLSMVTTSDCLNSTDGHGRIAGTVKEQAFDIISINFDQHTIKTVRVGGGNDRTFTL